MHLRKSEACGVISLNYLFLSGPLRGRLTTRWWVVEGVAEWCSGVAEPAGWGEFGVAVCDADLPVLAVHPVMMKVAEQHGVVQRGGTTVGPMQNVMDGAPTRRPIAPGKGAALIADDQRAADRRGHHIGGAADVQRLGVGAENGRDDLRVAGQPAGRLRADPLAAGAVQIGHA